MATAPELFKAMLKEQLAPSLRALGVKGSGTSYSVPSQSHWALLGVQGSSSNSAASVRFTINCKVVRKDLWAATYAERPYVGERPKANVHAGVEWWERIGRLMPRGRDTWWRLRPSDDPLVVCNEVVTAIKDHALPAMLREIDRTSVT